MLLNCQYNQIQCRINDFKLVFHELYGNCFVFNSERIKIASKYGPKFGLNLELFIGKKESNSPMSSSTGAIIFINNENSFLSQSQSSYQLAPGSQTNIAINRVSINKLPR
jgi:hypothetical protein